MKKGKLLFAGFAAVCAVVFCVQMIPVIERWMLPEMLRDSRNENGEALRFELHDTKAVVFYPKNNETEFVKTMTTYIRDDLMKLEISTENLKVDYRSAQAGNLLFLCFDAVNTEGDLIKMYSGICNTETHETVEFRDLVQDSFYEVLSSELRYQIKESGVLGDVAYTNGFYEKTRPDKIKDVLFYLDEQTAEVTVNLDFEELSQFKVELDPELFYSLMNEDQALYQQGNLVHPMRHFVDVNRPMVALTFDDGPVRKNTLLALELLNAYDARGTFFMLGYRMERNPDVVLDVVNQGHEVGSHTYNHPDLTSKSTNLNYQYSRNQEILSEITQGQVSIELLRPPYGSFNSTVKSTSPYPLIMWSLDTLDWKTLDPAATHENIMTKVKDGDVILLHDLHEPSVESLRTVLPALVDAGYQIVTVSELMEARGIEMKNGVSYSKARKE